MTAYVPAGEARTGVRTFTRPCRVIHAATKRKTTLHRRHLLTATYAARQATAPLKLRPLDSSYEDAHKFASFSNWIIPDHLMIGRYPYVEPGELKKCATHAQGEAQLKRILEAGIRTFVCLQSDVRGQHEMPTGGDKGFLPYKQPVEFILSSMAGPPPKQSIEGIRNPFLNKFLPKKDAQVEKAPSMECTFVHHPVKGLKTLTPEDLNPVLADLSDRLEAGDILYMHCWGGRGRAGTVTCCLLTKMFGLSSEEAIERVSRSFYTREDDSYPSALSDEQIAFVKRFVDH